MKHPLLWFSLFFMGFHFSAYAFLGPSDVHAGDTCWYTASYYDGINSQPAGSFSNVVGGTIIQSFWTYTSTSACCTHKEIYIQVVWGNPGAGSITYMFDAGNGNPYTFTTRNITIGPAGNIDPKIIGPDFTCHGDTATYQAEIHPGSSYQWDIRGGYVISGQGTPQVEVLFSLNNTWHDRHGSIFLTETNNGHAASAFQLVGHTYPSVAYQQVIRGPANPCSNTQSTYVASALANTFNWAVSGGTLLSGQGTDTIVVQWPTFGMGNGSIQLSVSGSGINCYTVQTKNITYGSSFANYPQLFALGSANWGSTVTYSTPANGGHTYLWTVSSGGSIVSGQGTNVIQVQWNSPGPQTVTVSETGPSCGSISQTANINVTGFACEVSATDSTLQVGYGPQQCATLSVTTLPNAPSPNYLWSTGATTPTITVCPNTTTTYSVTVTDFSLGIATDDVLIEVENVACGSGSNITICRNLGLFSFTQCLPPFLASVYLAQGSTLGACVNKMGHEPVENYLLELNPNPFASQAKITLAISESGFYSVDLVDLEGRVVKEVLQAEMSEGEFREMKMERAGLASGMYFLRLKGPGIVKLQKVLVQ